MEVLDKSTPGPASYVGPTITEFPNASGQSKMERVLDIEHLVNFPPRKSKARLPWLKLATFGDEVSDKGCLRNDANVQSLTGSEGDYDGPPKGSTEAPMEMPEAVQILKDANINAILYTSPSNAPGDPRWRVLLPFSQEYAASQDDMRAYRKAALRHVEGVLGITFARESYTLSQSYFYGPVKGKEDAYLVEQTAGDFIDTVVNLKSPAPAKNGASVEHDFLLGMHSPDQFVLEDKIREIATGENYHGAMISLFGHWAAKGMPLASAITTAQELMRASGDGSNRWQDRYDNIERCANDIYAKELKRQAAEDENAAALFYEFKAEGIGGETFGQHVPASVPFVVGGLIPQTSFGIAGAGGSLKSTTMLRIMMHTVLGLPIFKCEILKPGPCVFVSSEDDLQTIRHRVRMMVDAMGLSKEQRAVLAKDLIIEDTNGYIARLVEQDDKGNLRYSAMFQQMLERYKGRHLAIVCFDPMIYFGPGENFVNDGPGLLMNAARRFSAEMQCATGYLHHTGQEAYREGLVDMYAGRGGTAFADNARMVGVMTHPTNPKKYPMPEGMRHLVAGNAEAQVVQLHIAKQSYTKAQPQPLWILRDPTDPWKFYDIWGKELASEVVRERAEEDALKVRHWVLFKVWQHLKEEIEAGRFPNKTSIRESLEVKISDKKVGKTRLGEMVELGINHGFIREEELPDAQKQGARKWYLEPAVEPFVGTGGLELAKTGVLGE